MDAIVQFIRNILCCAQDLNVLPETHLHIPIPNVLKELFDYDLQIPAPLHLTTPLEFMICLSQFYAHYSSSKSGYLLMQESYAKLKYMEYILGVREAQKSNAAKTKTKSKADADNENENENDNNTSDKMKMKMMTKVKAEKILDERLQTEKKGAIKDFIVGACVFPIGVGFFWLFGNSLHVTSTGWIGGLPALMLALAVMEVALVPLLYYMLVDGYHKTVQSANMTQLADTGSWKNLQDHDQIKNMNNTTFGYLSNHQSIWLTNKMMSWKIPKDSVQFVPEVQKQFAKDIESIQSELDIIMTSKDAEQFDMLSEELNYNARKERLEGWREYIYFILNLLAFYGYLLAVIVYIWDDESNQPGYIDQIKLGWTNDYADWAGNFLGDFMWTIEPIIILSSPFLIALTLPQKKMMKKAKSS